MIGKVNDTFDLVKNGLDAQIALATAGDKNKLAEAKLALAELKILIADLKEENSSLLQQMKLSQEVTYGKSGAAWVVGEAYCGGCYGSAGKLVHLTRLNDTVSDCPTCKARYRNVNKSDQKTT